MSHFGSNGGGRTRMSTKVFLNIYDLSPINQYLYPIGFGGLYHTGVEIMGTEYTFASGSGIFNATPKYAPGAIFREQIELGIYDGSSLELNKVLDELRNGKFGPNDYNIVERNCNHFANTLCYKLLNKQIPGYINRLADIGMCCSCLLPKSMLKNAPVGDTSSTSGSTTSSSFLVKAPPGRMIMNDRSSTSTSSTPKVSNGIGARLGGTTSSTSASSSNGSTNSSSNDNNEEKKSLISSIFNMTTSINKSNNDNSSNNSNSNSQQRHDAADTLLTDRREKARKAALARLDQQQQQQQKSDKSL